VRDHRDDLEADLDTLSETTDVLDRQKMRVLEQILWLPVLSKGARAAYDAENKRVLVRDATPGIKP
jgi:hypothetical protein